MSIHIGAKKGEIAESILLPGDPLRAKYIADNYLENVICYNNIRGMFGFTGEYNGKRVSVQGSGMGLPSISIYINELMGEYNVQNLIRIGTCGSFKTEIKCRDLILAMSSSTTSSMNKRRFSGDYSPTADFSLLYKAYNKAKENSKNIWCGNILSSDEFYEDNAEDWKKWADFGVLGVEMETTALYTLAAKYGRKALSILTVSDSVVDGTMISSEDRQSSLDEMIKLALYTIS